MNCSHLPASSTPSLGRWLCALGLAGPLPGLPSAFGSRPIPSLTARHRPELAVPLPHLHYRVADLIELARLSRLRLVVGNAGHLERIPPHGVTEGCARAPHNIVTFSQSQIATVRWLSGEESRASRRVRNLAPRSARCGAIAPWSIGSIPWPPLALGRSGHCATAPCRCPR